MIVLTAALSTVFLIANFGQIVPIPGAVKLTSGLICEKADCEPTTQMDLPYFTQKVAAADLRTTRFRFFLPSPEDPSVMQAVYVPKFADHIAVTLNGTELRSLDTTRRQWLEPQLINAPAALFNATENILDIVIAGRPSEGLELYPIFVGPRTVLHSAYIWRFGSGPAFARINLAFMLILGITYLLVWWNRREDSRYLWLGLSCACGCIVLLQFGYGILSGGYKFWLGTTHLAVAFYTLFVMKFIRIHLRLDELRIERILLLILLCALLMVGFVPDGDMQFWAFLVNTVTAVAAVAGLTVFWMYRTRVDLFDFFVIFSCLLTANALGTYEMILVYSPQPERSFHLFHFVPVCMSLVCLWVIVTQLVRSLRRYETLTETLSDTIALKTHQLEKSFNRLAKVERREAVDRERNRIMLDLHDGIGGQLVSTLAYMESTGNKDETLKDALEAALRDLALVLDSLDSHDSLTTLLGMLRTRLEPLLAEHGLRFSWQILDDPIVPQAGPSSNLHLARIVQEAITNVIKHAKASTITVYTDARTIMISDDGVGIDDANLMPGDCTGHGLAGMRQRAESMGADFDVRRSDKGTSVCLTFADQGATSMNDPAVNT